MGVWVSFPERYQLQDVQAGLNVVIAVLSASGIFVFVRYCWQIAARKVAEKKNVPVYSLLSLNTIGEAWDVVWLLKRDLFTTHYLGLLAQCLIVLSLTASTILSGLIARISTQNGYIIESKDVNGTLALRRVTGLILADVEWNTTLANILRSKIPTNQLLEYLPDQTSNWVYNSQQWNSSWSMDCAYTDQTELQLVDTGNCTNADIFSEIPGLTRALNASAWDDNSWDYSYWQINNTMLKDVLLFFHGVSWGTYDKDLLSYTDMNITSVAVHMSFVPTNKTLAAGCSFSKGPIGASDFTAMTCKLTRSTSGLDEAHAGAYPDFSDRQSVASAYTAHFASRFRQESARSHSISTVSGQELAQLYQAYSIVRDTAIGPFTTRKLDVSVRVPQISLICLVVCCIGAFLILLGLLHYAWFINRHWEAFQRTPESKLDWILQTIQAGGTDRASARQKLRNSMTSATEEDSLPLRPTKQANVLSPGATREEFEGATWLPYRTPSLRTTTSYTSLQPPKGSPYMYTEQEETSYDPTRRPLSHIQPIEDGYFQNRWT